MKKILIAFMLFVQALSSDELSVSMLNTSKSLYTQLGFYAVCGQKKLIKTNIYAQRWSNFNASKYYMLSKNPNESDLKNIRKATQDLMLFLDKWVKQGEKGLLVIDPSSSDKTRQVAINKENCAYVNKIIETNFSFMFDYIFKENKGSFEDAIKKAEKTMESFK